MHTPLDFEALSQRYGSHSGAARALEISPRHYLRVRNGAPASKALIKLIRDEIEKVKSNKGVYDTAA